MNEITRIHIAKTAYDIEIAAKKQLEKYIKNLEAYTQDKEVLEDIEIRITELLAERGVKAGGVISSDDVQAIRKQLGEPHEFADEEGDIAVGPVITAASGRRLYRSTDDAVLGGVLSGVATYFNINPLWTRLAFVVLLFISFGFASLIYILLWIVLPAAKTATEKLQLAGKEVTVESIRALNAGEDKLDTEQSTPILVKVLSVGLGIASGVMAVVSFAFAFWLTVSAITMTSEITDFTANLQGFGPDATWIVWSLFWVVVFGVLLFTALTSLIAYSLFKKKLTKKMLLSGLIIVILGIASFATVVGVSTTQSFRVANESRSLVRDTKVTLPKELADIKSMRFELKAQKVEDGEWLHSPGSIDVRYVVDDGPVRYELSALPTTSVTITADGENAVTSVDIGSTFRNSFVRPELIIYGPALDLVVSKSVNVQYEGKTQENLRISPTRSTQIIAVGSFNEVTVTGEGSADLSSSTVGSLTVNSGQHMMVTAGTVRELHVTQPDVCPSNTYSFNAQVSISAVTAGEMTYNGVVMPAKTHQTSCAAVIFEAEEEFESY